MSKSLKLKNDTYIDSSSVNYKRKNLEQFLVNRFTLDDINIGKLTDFNQQYGYKQVSIKVPANSIMIVCGVHTEQVDASSGLQITNINNGLYFYISQLISSLSFKVKHESFKFGKTGQYCQGAQIDSDYGPI